MIYFCRFPLIALALALAAGWTSQAAASDVKSQASDVGPASTWPVVVRRFWQARARETVQISGQVWVTTVQQKGDELADNKAPAAQALALAYQQPGAPNYVRLEDGKQARNLAEIAARIKGVSVLRGMIESVDADAHTLKMSVTTGGYGYQQHGVLVTHLKEDQMQYFRGLIPPANKKERFEDQHGHVQPMAQVLVIGTKPRKHKPWQAVHVVGRPVTPQALRTLCRENEITQWPDFRPVRSKHEPEFKEDAISILPFKHIAYTAAQYSRQDFKWFAHPIIIPPMMR